MGIDELNYLKEHLEMSLKDDLLASRIDKDEISITIRLESLKSVIKFLCEDPTCEFKMLIDISAIDYPNEKMRFIVFYHLLSLQFNHRLRLKVQPDEKLQIATVTDLYESAGWYEREVFDMFGIEFEGNNDLRRILTDYGFEGNPLRKDFPMNGYNEVRYDEKQGKVVYEPIKKPAKNLCEANSELPKPEKKPAASSGKRKTVKSASTVQSSAKKKVKK